MEAGLVTAVVLAAGSSSRFGSPKALAVLRGKPLLQHVLDTAAGLTLTDVVVVLGERAPEIESRLVWRSERRLVNPDPGRGLSSSLKIGLGALDPGCEAALVLLGDQPLVRRDVIERLLAALTGSGRPIVLPRYAGGGGPNPVLLHRSAWGLAADTGADRGLGPLLRRHPELVVEVAVEGSNPDVDTPADLAELEAGAAALFR